MPPLGPFGLVQDVRLIDKQQCQQQEHQQVAAHGYHEVEGVERQRHIGNSLLGTIQIGIAKVLEIGIDGTLEAVLQHCVATVHRGTVLRHHLLQPLAALHALGIGNSVDFITLVVIAHAIDDVLDAGHKGLEIVGGKE